MATISDPIFFFANTQAKSSEVNANFDAFYNAVNGVVTPSLVHRDGTNPFTALPSIAANPTVANSLVRYAYSQQSLEIASVAGFGLVPFGTLDRQPSSANTRKWMYVMGTATPTLVAGRGVITLPVAFPNQKQMVLVTAGDTAGTNTNGARLGIDEGDPSNTNGVFVVKMGNSNVQVRINYIAIGY